MKPPDKLYEAFECVQAQVQAHSSTLLTTVIRVLYGSRHSKVICTPYNFDARDTISGQWVSKTSLGALVQLGC